MAEPIVEATVSCPGCPEGTADPQLDGDWRFYQCRSEECGYTFGFVRIGEPVLDTCQLGLPVVIPEPAGPVLLTIGRRPE